MTSDPHQSHVSITVSHPVRPYTLLRWPRPFLLSPRTCLFDVAKWLYRGASSEPHARALGSGQNASQPQNHLLPHQRLQKISPVASLSSSSSDPHCSLVLVIPVVICGAFFSPVCTLKHQVLHFCAPPHFQGHFHPLQMHPPTHFTRL